MDPRIIGHFIARLCMRWDTRFPRFSLQKLRYQTRFVPGVCRFDGWIAGLLGCGGLTTTATKGWSSTCSRLCPPPRAGSRGPLRGRFFAGRFASPRRGPGGTKVHTTRRGARSRVSFWRASAAWERKGTRAAGAGSRAGEVLAGVRWTGDRLIEAVRWPRRSVNGAGCPHGWRADAPLTCRWG
jgi:hypothetical protein